MTLKDLINRHHWASVKYHLVETYPNEAEQIDAYDLVYEELIRQSPKFSAMRIVVEEQPGLDDEAHIDVSGRDGTLQKELDEFQYCNEAPDSAFANSEVSYAIEFCPWAEWLGMKIDPKSLGAFGEEAIIAHCIWEMTFVDFDETSIQESLDGLKATVEEIKRMTDDQRSDVALDHDGRSEHEDSNN